jgi:hypothetical protein
VATGTAVSDISTVAVSLGSPDCPSEFGLPPAKLASLDAGGVIRAAVLSFSSKTFTASGGVSQAAQTWVAEYDAAYLSALAAAAQPLRGKGVAFCTRIDRSRGLHSVAGATFTTTITGASGCSWSFTSDASRGFPPPGCIGSSYMFTSDSAQIKVSGPLPLPRPANAITSLSMTPQSAISWTVNPSPQDGVTLVLGSMSSPGPFGAWPSSNTQVACDTSVVNSPFTFPPAALAQAYHYPQHYGPSMSLTSITDQAFPQNNSPLLDLVLVRVANTTQVTGPFN